MLKNVSLKLFDSLVRPILLYGVDVWDCFKHAFNDDNPIEKLDLKLCKDILWVKQTTSNFASWCELGRRQLHALGFRSLTKNLLCVSDGKSNEIMTHAYRSNIQLELTWSRCLKYIFFSHGFGDIWENRIKTFESIGATHVINQRVIDCSNRNTLLMLKNQLKMRTYSTSKTTVKIEKYVSNVKSVERRTLLSK